MELIDRYLQAVEFWLPAAERRDIIAELAEEIRSHIEEKEAGLGCSLTESELGALLKQRRVSAVRLGRSRSRWSFVAGKRASRCL